MADVDLVLRYPAGRRAIPSPQRFAHWLTVAAQTLEIGRPIALSMSIIDADDARRYNQRYRGLDYAPNVLSFAVELPAGVSSPELGDVLLCAPVIAAEARAQNKSVAAHYAHLTVHGLLHLLGHDHQHEAEARQMEALEVQVLAALGFPDPYQ